MPWHDREPDEVVAALGTSAAMGLGAAEVVERRARSGPNAQPEPPPRSRWARLVGQVANPLIYLLVVAALVAFALGDLSDGIVILVVVAINAVIGAFQEGRAEQALIALRRMTAVQARVVRDGAEQTIDARELVPGDVVVIAAGDAIAAD
ncbi:MAG: haloacid dehalogenase, partial [Deltaproteobacteria bacterium]|nr:haloacid dehalogenase [Kofleriaceae bacterium]